MPQPESSLDWSLIEKHFEKPELTVESSSEKDADHSRLERKVKSKKYCLGCPSDLSLDAPGLDEMTDQVLAYIDDDSDRNHKHKLLELVRAQRQVTSVLILINSLYVLNNS